MKRKILISIIIIVSQFAWLNAQSNRILYYMNLPQKRNLNPALTSSDSVYIGLPGISGIGINLNNNILNFQDVLMRGQSDSLVTFLHPSVNIEDFISRIKDRNFIEPELTIPVFSLAFPVKKGYIFFDVNERAEMNAVIPGSLIELGLRGNGSYAGDYVDLSNFRAGMKIYHEIGLGFSRKYSTKLRAGFKGKVLFGLANFSVTPSSLGIRISDDYSHTLDADLTVNMSGPINITRDEANHIKDIQPDEDLMLNTLMLKGPKNLGFAVDMGATYMLTKKIMLSAAVTDLGFINWKSNVTNLRTNDVYKFDGFDITGVMNGDRTFDQVTSGIADSLKESFSFTETNDPFRTMLPTGLNLGASYNLSKNFSLGLLSSSRIIGKQVREALTVSTNLRLGTMVSTSLSYTAANHRFDNIGAGLMLRMSIFQFYVLTDNIPIFWNKLVSFDDRGNPESTIYLPDNWNTVDLKFGMNLVFGHRKARKAAKFVPEGQTVPGNK
ncbi:MAG TPA: DUF5723 family protein [Bacteroidales bacterium]|nr:DUF5723 family protein [Bacteroidales bacterium]